MITKIKNTLAKVDGVTIQIFYLGLIALLTVLLIISINGPTQEDFKKEQNYERGRLIDSLETVYRLRYIDTLTAVRGALIVKDTEYKNLIFKMQKENERYNKSLDSINRILGWRPRY